MHYYVGGFIILIASILTLLLEEGDEKLSPMQYLKKILNGIKSRW